jgi:hypothetical protein
MDLQEYSSFTETQKMNYISSLNSKLSELKKIAEDNSIPSFVRQMNYSNQLSTLLNDAFNNPSAAAPVPPPSAAAPVPPPSAAAPVPPPVM